MKARNNIHPRRLTAGTQKTSPIEKKEKNLNQTSHVFWPEDVNHGSVKHGCISNRIVTFQIQLFFPCTMIMGGKSTPCLLFGGELILEFFCCTFESFLKLLELAYSVHVPGTTVQTLNY